MTIFKKSHISAAAMVDLWVQMHATPEDKAVFGAFNIKGWKEGLKQLDQVTISAYSNIPLRTLKRVLEKMVQKKLLLRRFGPGRVYIYEKNVVEMTWDECHEVGRSRINQMRSKCQTGTLGPKTSKCQTGTVKVPTWLPQSAKVVPPNINKVSSKVIEREGTPLSMPSAEALKELNLIRQTYKLEAIPESPKNIKLVNQALYFYGLYFSNSYIKYVTSKDKHWGPNFPLAGFASESQIENWKVSAPTTSRCQHANTQDEQERMGATKHNAAGIITIRRCVKCKKKLSEIFVPDPAWAGHDASA